MSTSFRNALPGGAIALMAMLLVPSFAIGQSASNPLRPTAAPVMRTVVDRSQATPAPPGYEPPWRSPATPPSNAVVNRITDLEDAGYARVTLTASNADDNDSQDVITADGWLPADAPLEFASDANKESAEDDGPSLPPVDGPALAESDDATEGDASEADDEAMDIVAEENVEEEPATIDDTPNDAPVTATAENAREAKADVAEDESSAPPALLPAPTAPAAPPTLPQNLIPLRDQTRRVLGAHYARTLSTQSNTPWQILSFCLPYGVEANVRHGERTPQPANAIGVLCWNFPCRGGTMMRLTTDGRTPLPKLGCEFQQTPGEFLAMLAMSRVPPDYGIRCSDFEGTIADLVEYEKRSCYEGDDLSMKLIGLSFYLEPDATWKNATGEDWSIGRMIDSELQREVSPADARATNRLLGLAFALRTIPSPKPDSPAARAAKYVEEFRRFALAAQNPDGSWNARFFAARGPSSNADAALTATGHVLRWLLIATPQEELNDARLARAATYLSSMLAKKSPRTPPSDMASRDFAGQMTALQTLAIYDQRYFKPFDPPAETPNERSAMTSGQVIR